MPSYKTGDRVKVVDRDMTTADVKSGLFYDYFRNLTGAVERVYDDNSVCLRVDMDSLPENVQIRHGEVEEATKKRWLDGLGPEQLGRLSEADKKVALRYNILVGAGDLEPTGKAKPSPKQKAESKPEPAAKKAAQAQIPERRTQEDIEKAEDEYLKRIASEEGAK